MYILQTVAKVNHLSWYIVQKYGMKKTLINAKIHSYDYIILTSEKVISLFAIDMDDSLMAPNKRYW